MCAHVHVRTSVMCAYVRTSVMCAHVHVRTSVMCAHVHM